MVACRKARGNFIMIGKADFLHAHKTSLHTHTHPHTHIHSHTHTHPETHTHILTCNHTQTTHTHIHTHVPRYTPTHTPTHTHPKTHRHTSTSTHMSKHIHIYTHNLHTHPHTFKNNLLVRQGLPYIFSPPFFFSLKATPHFFPTGLDNTRKQGTRKSLFCCRRKHHFKAIRFDKRAHCLCRIFHEPGHSHHVLGLILHTPSECPHRGAGGVPDSSSCPHGVNSNAQEREKNGTCD